MAEKKCKYCAMMIPSDASICPLCRKRQGMPIFTMILAGLAVFILTVIVINSFDQPAKKPMRVAPEKQDDSFRKMSPAEHLQAAKDALADGYKPHKDVMKMSYGNIEEAKKHILFIPSTAPEYQETRALKGEIMKREAKIHLAARQIAKEITTNERKKFAEKYELALLDNGMDTQVTVSGKHNTTLKIQWAAMTRPLVHKLINDERTVKSLTDIGFEKVIFTDGYDRSWAYDFGK